MVQSVLVGVDARTTTDGWAVGYGSGSNNLARTLVERWDGSAWTRVKTPNAGQPANGELSDVVAVAADDIWAVGTWLTKAFDDRTRTFHRDGGGWHRVKSPNVGPTSAANDLVLVSAVAADDVWAVGVRGLHTLTMHRDGTGWSAAKTPTPGGNADLAAVAALGPDDAWAVAGSSIGRPTPCGRSSITGTARPGRRWRARTRGRATTTCGGSRPRRAGCSVGDRFGGGGSGPVVPLSLERC
jgi:hypothetical protein